MDKPSETYRLDMLRLLQEKYLEEKPKEVIEAEKLLANYRQQQKQVMEAIPRLEQPIPRESLCPQCWFLEGHQEELYRIDSPQPNFTRMRCRRCEYIIDFPQARHRSP